MMTGPPGPALSRACFRAYIALGANVGDARKALAHAVAGIAALPWTTLVSGSSLYRTAPVDATGPDFTNAVLAVDTALGPLELLHALQALELAHGRQRPYRNAPRTLDLDVVWHGALCLSSPELTLPHPRYQGRAFVLEPLAEVLAASPTPSVSPELPSDAARCALAHQQGIEKLAENLLKLALER